MTMRPALSSHVADASFAATDNDLQILERSTPFFIWANYPLEHTAAATSTADPLNRMDMVMLAPTLLQQAGLPLSDYYEYLLEMKQNTPVVTAANDYMKVDGSDRRVRRRPSAGRVGQGVSECWNTTTSARTPSGTRAFLTPPSKRRHPV